MPFDGTPHLIKPEGIWALDRGHPLARGLAFFLACTEGGGNPIDLVTGDAWTRASGVVWARGRHGLELDGVTGGVAQGPNDAIGTSDGAGTGNFSVAVLANPSAAATIKALYYQRLAGGEQGGILANCSGSTTPTVSSGTILFATAVGSNNTEVSVASAIDGEYHLWCGVRSGTTLTLDEDGAQIGTTSGTVRDIANGSEAWFGARNAAMGLTERGVFCVAWNRALSAQERRNLPWAIWQLLAQPSEFGVAGFKAPGGTTFNQALTASSTATASLIKQVGKPLTASSTATAVLEALKVVLVALTAAASATATLVKQVGKPLTASATGTATLIRGVIKTLSATATGAATLDAIKVVLITLAAAATATASMTRQVGKVLAASGTGAASVTKAITKTLAAAGTGTATLAKSIAKTLVAGASGLASLVADLIAALASRPARYTASDSAVTAWAASDSAVTTYAANDSAVTTWAASDSDAA